MPSKGQQKLVTNKNSWACLTEQQVREQLVKKPSTWGFPGGAVVKNLPANAGDTSSSPGLGRSHMPQSN